MSKVTKIRVKGSDGTFAQEVNIGTFSSFVNMQDGLTLEEEFKLGGNCITSFNTSSEGVTTIIEEFRLEDQTSDFYKISTVFESTDEGMIITQELFYIDEDSNETSIKVKTITFQSSDTNDLIIKEVIE